MILSAKCLHEYEGAIKSATIFIDGMLIGDIFQTEEFGRGNYVVLVHGIAQDAEASNAQFATWEGAIKYMKLIAFKLGRK